MQEKQFKIGDHVLYNKLHGVIHALRRDGTHKYVVTYKDGWNNNTSTAFNDGTIFEGKLSKDINYHFASAKSLRLVSRCSNLIFY